MPCKKSLEELIINRVEKLFAESGSTKFPTVREVAKQLRCRQDAVIAAVEDSSCLDLQGYNWCPLTKGDLEVYSYGVKEKENGTTTTRRKRKRIKGIGMG